MESQGGISLYSYIQDITTSPLPAKDDYLWAQDNKSYPNLFNNVTSFPPITLFQAYNFPVFSTAHAEAINHIEGVLQMRTAAEQNENANSSSPNLCDVQSIKSSYEAQQTEKVSPCAYSVKGFWTAEEDRKLIKLVKNYGLRKWALIADQMVGRIGKQCRERWQNHLRPDIKKSIVWTDEEERTIIQAHEKFGNRWVEIAKCVPGRSENAIKNHWNATIRKQTSKRKIRRPERLRGLTQSTVLEEYIKKRYFNNESTNPKTESNNGALSQIDGLINEDEASYMTLETFEEEMNFMKNLFSNKDNNNISSNE